MCQSDSDMCPPDSFRLWLLEFLTLLGLLAFFLWLGMRPKAPSYTVADLSVIDQGEQNGNISFTLKIENPNKDSGIYYDDTFFTIYYKETAVQKTITKFHQGKGEIDNFHVNDNARVWKALLNEISNRTVEVRVELLNRIQYRTWGIRSKHHSVHMKGHARIGSDGKITGKKKNMKLHNASKKWRIKLV